MRLRTAFALSALLAGAGSAWAQDATATSTTSGMAPTSAPRPGLLSDYLRTKRTAQPSDASATSIVPAGATVMTVDNVPATAQPTVNMDCGVDCGPCHKVYGSAEYLLWRIGSSFDDPGTNNFPVVTTRVPYVFVARGVVFSASDEPFSVTTNGDPVSLYGLVDLNPILFAGSNINSNDRNGYRLNLGVNLSQWCSVEATWFQLEQRTQAFRAVAASNILFENTGLTDLQNQPEVEGVRPPPVATPASFAPVFTDDIVGSVTNRMWGLEINGRGLCCRIGSARIEGIVGVRYVQFEERQALLQQLGVQELTHVGSINGDGDFIPSEINYTNLATDISARNRFYGVQAGLFGEWMLHGFFVNGTAKLAVGGMHQEFKYDQTVFTGSTLPDALLPTMPNNVYPYPTSFSENRVRLSWLPELQANLGYEFTDCCRGWVGYNAMYIQRVVRPIGNGLPVNGDGTITRSGETSAAIGPAITNFNETKLVVHGLTVGVELRY